MATFRVPLAFVFLFLCLCFMHCSKDGHADLEVEDGVDTTEICVPELITPASGAELDNGCAGGADPLIWSFDWESCENSDYNLVVWSSGDTLPLIDVWLDDSEYVYNKPSSYIADSNRYGWTWKVRAAVDGMEGPWSEEREFSVEPAGRDCENEEEFFTDPRDGNVYLTLKIGNQVWMTENLRAVIYPDGSPIAHVEDAEQWEAQHGSGAYCWYDNTLENQFSYGALYNHYAAMKGAQSSDSNPSGIQGVCPSGWHLPSDQEWKELELFSGMSQTEADKVGWRGTNEGSKLAGQVELWGTSGQLTENPEFGTSGFSAIPAGHRNPDYLISNFSDFGSGTSWWSATGSYARDIKVLNSRIYRNSFDSRYGFSVRCVRN